MPVYERAQVGTRAPIAGPLVIVENYSTIFLPQDWHIAAAPTGDLVARRA
jgi:hypothetical protein